MTVGDGGRTGVVQRIIRISNVDAAGVERADPNFQLLERSLDGQQRRRDG